MPRAFPVCPAAGILRASSGFRKRPDVAGRDAGYGFWRPGREDLSAAAAAFGAEIDDPVGRCE